jgi:hypothetical protein
MTPELLSLEEAAAYLGCRPRTLRALVDRSRVRLRGCPVQGPTIQFFQPYRKGAIKFRQAWLDAFIEAGSHRPDKAPLVTKIAPPRPDDDNLPATERQPTLALAHGFGPMLFDS